MSYLGNYLKGELVPVTFVAVDADDAPAVPSQAPSAIVYQGATALATFKFPAIDQLKRTGVFQYMLFLGSSYTAGSYRIEYEWIISGNVYADVYEFDVATAGAMDGPGISLTTVNHPAAQYALMHTRSGRIIKRRNPRSL